MKKGISVVLTLLMVLSLSTAAFADNFISSMSNGDEPEPVSAVDSIDEDVTGFVTVASYNKRGELADEDRNMLEDAFKAISQSKSLTSLNAQLKDTGYERAIAVKDLFFIGSTEEVAFPVNVKIFVKNLTNFMALLRYENGDFAVVDAKADGDILSFQVDEPGAFAVIVHVESENIAGSASSARGIISGSSISTYMYPAAGVLLLCIAGLLIVKGIKSGKKEKQPEETRENDEFNFEQ